VYWRVAKNDVYLLVSHPDNAKIKGRQKILFLFGNGKRVVFPMRGKGTQLQVPIGMGLKGQAFYSALTTNKTVSIEMAGVSDRVTVDLSRRQDVEYGMALCRQFMH